MTSPSSFAVLATLLGIVILPTITAALAGGARSARPAEADPLPPFIILFDVVLPDFAPPEDAPPLPLPLPPVQPAMPAAAAVDVIARNFLRELPLFVILSPDDIRLPSRSLN